MVTEMPNTVVKGLRYCMKTVLIVIKLLVIINHVNLGLSLNLSLEDSFEAAYYHLLSCPLPHQFQIYLL